MEIQNLLDEHRAALDIKRQEFEAEIEEKRKLLEEENRAKLDNLDKRESEINHLEEKLEKRKEAVEKKAERVKGKEKDVELTLKGLKEREKALKLEEKNLDILRRELNSDKESLQAHNDEIEKMKAEIHQQKLQIHDDTEKLRVTDEERQEHNRLILELKQEIERYKHQRVLLSEKTDYLKEDRKKFEEEWEVLDEKRAEVTREAQQLEEDKRTIENLKHSVERQLKEDKIATENHIKRELEALRIEKESFAASMKYEQSVLSEESRQELTKLHHDFETRRKNLEDAMLKKQEEIERALQEREREFEEKAEKERSYINQSKDSIEKKFDDMKSERSRLEEDKQNIALNKRQLEQQQLEMHNDINELSVLSRKLKSQREQLINERSRFVSFLETRKSCQNCGDMARDYMLSDILTTEPEVSPLHTMGEQLLERVAAYEVQTKRTPCENDPKSSESGGRISWFLKKCTPKIFNVSPSKKVQDVPSQNLDQALSDTLLNVADNVGGPSMPAEAATQTDSPGEDLAVQEVAEEPKHLETTSHRQKSSRKAKDRIHRTRSVKDTVEDAAAFLGSKSGDMQLNEDNPTSVNEESRADSGVAEKAVRRKRTRAQSSKMTESEDAYDSEGRSESVTTGGRRKRHQTGAPAVPNAGRSRYYLRRHVP